MSGHPSTAHLALFYAAFACEAIAVGLLALNLTQARTARTLAVVGVVGMAVCLAWR